MNKIIEKVEYLLELGGTKKDAALLCISAISLLFSLLKLPLPFDAAWIAVILCGIPIICEAIIGLVTKFDIKADVLVSLALAASVCIGEIFAAGEVAFIMQAGALLENLTVAKAKVGIEKLVRLSPQTARVINDGAEKIVPAEAVAVGDVLRVLPGETIPVDGVITSGQTSVNQAVMTGESLPVDKAAGDSVQSGTVNQFGVFEMKAERVGADSAIQRMISLVRSADAGKAKIVRLADRWATWIVIAALAAAVLAWLITGEIIRAVTVLVVFCPCALVLATPTAIVAAMGNASKHGFLVREGDALERLSSVSEIAFDKTGTLTYGAPEVTKIKSVSEKYSEKDIYALAAAAEQFSEHPLGKAVVKCFKARGDEPLAAENFKMLPGKGVAAAVNGTAVLAGNLKLLSENGVALPEVLSNEAEKYTSLGSAVIYVSANGEAAGFIVLTDTVREESAQMTAEIKSLGVEPILLTGDNENTAEAVARKVGINAVYAQCLPEDKLRRIAEYQSRNRAVCMVGDGINDAPALKSADIGIAMGGIGSDIAADAADIVLANDEVKELPHLISLSKKMMRTIKLNLTFSMTLNFAAVALAITGILNPVVGALVHNAGSVLVIINSALLLSAENKRRFGRRALCRAE